MPYIRRAIEPVIVEYLKHFPVVGLTGSRQSGKSTTLRKILADTYKYVSFDDIKEVESFHTDPKSFMREHADAVVFDEIQKVPEIFSYIKINVDNDRSRYGKYVVTGSSQFSIMKNVSESLAGRIGLLALLPFQHSEVPRSLRDKSQFLGSYPELVTRKYTYARQWYTSYVDTYLTRDVRQLVNVGDMRDFQRCLTLLAARTGQLLSMSEIARDVGVSVPTIKKWISILEASYIVFLLPPYFSNPSKRIIKAPKVFFYDTGLISYLTGIENKQMYDKGPMYGNLFENYVVSEIVKRETHNKTHTDFYYYRTSHGVEVDLILDHRSWKELFEVKSSETFRPQMTSSIEKMMNKGDKGFLLYKGEALRYGGEVRVMNYADYLQ